MITRNGLPSLADIERAAELVYQYLPATPQYSWPLLNRRCGCEVWLKHENHTPIGAFKVRGGLVYMDWLRRAHPEADAVISATRGNHGQSLAFAARQFGLRSIVVPPKGNSREKNAAMQAFGAELIEHGDSFHAADQYVNRIAAERKLFRVPSFDLLLVRGVATYAIELFRGTPELEAVFVPIGLGSGILGVAAARNALGLKTEIIGVVSQGARTYSLSLAAGHVVEDAAKTDLADGLAVSRASDQALQLMRGEIGRIILVSDEEVGSAMRAIFADTHNVAEGAGAAGVAAILKERDRWSGKRIGTIISGGNVDTEVFANVLQVCDPDTMNADGV